MIFPISIRFNFSIKYALVYLKYNWNMCKKEATEKIVKLSCEENTTTDAPTIEEMGDTDLEGFDDLAMDENYEISDIEMYEDFDY